MFCRMGGPLHDFEIFGPVIMPNSVFVMHNLVDSRVSTDQLRHYFSVFI